MNTRILITDGLTSGGKSILHEYAEVIEADVSTLSDNFDALIVRSKTRITSDVVGRGKDRLRVIGRAGVGVDNIDLDAALDAGIVVVNAPEAATIATAELTMSFLLALSRHLSFADRSTRSGEWRKNEIIGTQLQGKTLGIIGVGRIGTAVALRAKSFGMEILGYDPELESRDLQRRGVTPTDWGEMMARADYISLNLPLSQETYHLVDKQAFASMKQGVRIVSTSRGGIIDESALLEALKTGHVGGAALDVFEIEPPQSEELRVQDNVILTPHIGGQTEEAQIQVAIDIAEEVLAALKGEPLRWRVV